MTQPGLPGAQAPPKDDWLVRRVQDLERELREFKQALAQQTGMSFVGGEIIIAADSVLRTSDFDGTTAPPAAGNNGLAITDGTLILNTLIAKNAIIGDEALTKPVDGAFANGTVGSLNIAGSLTTYDTETITVPAGFSEAFVMATSTAGLSANASGALISTRPLIGGNNGDIITSQAGANIAMSVSSTFSAHLTGLGASFTVAVQASMPAGGAVANTGNARISALAIFLR